MDTNIIMTDFIEALFNDNNPMVRYSLYAGILASIAFGISGTYVVTRRISYIAGAVGKQKFNQRSTLFSLNGA